MFTKHLANLSMVISTRGVLQVVEDFECDPSKFRDYIKSTEKYVLLAGRVANQTIRLVYQTSWGAFSDYIQYYTTENPDKTWELLKLRVEFKVCRCL